MKLPSFTLYEGRREHEKTIFFFLFQNSDTVVKVILNLTQKKIRQFQIERDGIRSKKFEAARIHFLCDVFASIGVVDA